MSAPSSLRPPLDRRLVSLGLFAIALAMSVLVGRAGAAGGGQLVAEPVLGGTAAGVKVLFGAAPQEAPGETWGIGVGSGGRQTIVRYTDSNGWEAVANPVDQDGKPVPQLRIPEVAPAGRTTSAGGVAAVASLAPGPEYSPPKALIVRDPGGGFRAVPSPPTPILSDKEELFAFVNPVASYFVKLAAVEEAGGKTGAFVVPSPKTVSARTEAVLHYDGSGWVREQVCGLAEPPTCNAPASGFNVLAVDASGPPNAWLLARQSTLQERAGRIMLMRREAGTGQWRQQPLAGPLGALFAKEKAEPAPGVLVTVGPREKGQPLTVTSSGVWLDATVTVGSQKSDATIYYDIASGEVTGTWCDLPDSTPEAARKAMCKFPLGSDLSSGEGRSFAWPRSGAPGDFGTRAVTGVGQGAMLILEGGAFTRIPLAGNGGGSAGAALSAPDQGWLGPSYRLTRAPVPSSLQPWPVPFRRPLTAIAPQPGVAVASLSSQALAVGDRGQVARYLPGQGWQPEALLTGSGARATPDLRGVAWPQPGIAFAVGDDGAMWLWRVASGLWESDPGAPPNLIRGNFTGIAFDPTDPNRGYAVGKQGLLLRYGRGWKQEALPPGLNPEVNITSIAFAGHEALATYTLAVPRPGTTPTYTGGLLVNNGSGWRVDQEAAQALALVEPGAVAPRRIAGLPDGGAVVVGLSGAVIERDAPGTPWRAVPGPSLGYPVAAAAIREGGQLRAILSVEGNPIGQATLSLERGTDEPQATKQPPPGQAGLLTHPYPLPKNGFIVRQTANGWRDEQRQSYPSPAQVAGQIFYDLPRVPDAVLALLISPDGAHGWAVGGSTGEIASAGFGPYQREGIQTGSAMRYGLDAAPPENVSGAPISTPTDEANFAIGGNAACVGPCADLVGTGIGPDVWLRAAVGRAATIPRLRAFLYTGSSVAPGVSGLSRAAFGEEESAYARRLASNAGSLPVYAAPADTDRYESSLATFAARFGGFPAPLGAAPSPSGITPIASADRVNGNYSYAFDSNGTGGRVRVIVLDYSVAPLSTEKQCWLADQLAKAKLDGAPAIVLGNREVGGETPVRQLLVTGANASCQPPDPAGASAYFFKGSANRKTNLTWVGASIQAFGTGTLGYTKIPETQSNEYVPASGFLLASVDVGERDKASNIAPVTADLIPNIGSLAIDAVDGTLLRRSQVALFQALARRPQAGVSCGGSIFAPETCTLLSPDSYVQIPARCLNKSSCAGEILPRYRFISSDPDIADFVKVDPTSNNPRAVLLGKNDKPIPDPSSGLLCAFNAGATTVTVEAGGFAYSARVSVQRGSVQRPCGTTPLRNPPRPQPEVPTPPPPLKDNPPSFTSGPNPLPPPPAPSPAPPAAQPAPAPLPQPAPAPFFSPAPALTPVIAILPPPPAPTVQTTPPSGTSPVTQPAVSPEPEEEEEAAFDLVHHMAAHRVPARPAAALGGGQAGGRSALPPYVVPAIVLLAAVAAAGGVGGRRRRSPRLARAYETRSR